MKTIIITLAVCVAAATGYAQPKAVAKAMKGVCHVRTYDKEGELLRQGVAMYVEDGVAVADYRIMKGAWKAVVKDADGKQTDVDCILGADGTYSVVRFSVKGKGHTAMTTAKTPVDKGTTLYVVGGGGNTMYETVTVSEISLINEQYAYYELDKQVGDSLIGSPVMDNAGKLVGILHAQVGTTSCVLDIRYAQDLRIEAIPNASSSAALNQVFIPKALPDTAEEALVYLYMQSRVADNDDYMDMVNRFVAAWPRNAEGYLRRATPLIDLHRFDEADADLHTYLSLANDKANGHYNTASLIFDKLRLQPEPPYEKWNADTAIDYVDKALAINAETSNEEERKAVDTKCRTLKAQIMMFKHDYDGAAHIYEALNEEQGGAPSYLYALSMAREGRGDSITAVIEPLDSALALMGTPLPAEAANYVIRRGQLQANAGRYREAVLDYNQYSYLKNSQVNDVFYYERSQIELNARMFQQALDDIERAIRLNPDKALYHVERASLAIRFDRVDDCIASCREAIRLNPAITDTYRILGYALIQKGDKEGGRENLQKAIDMGDESARIVMEQTLGKGGK